MCDIQQLRSKIRKVRQAIIDNLDADFNEINAKEGERLDKLLGDLLKQAKKIAPKHHDTLGDMYLHTYA